MKRFFEKYWLYLLFVFLIVVVIISLTFVLNNMNFDNSVLSVNYSSDEELIISNTLPMTDSVGREISLESNKIGTTGYVEFEVKSTVDNKVKYEVYLTKERLESEVPVKFVKVYLTDENDVAFDEFNTSRLPTYYDLRLSETDPSGKLLYTGSLKKKGSQKFKLRMWVADTYQLTLDEKMFSVKINVVVK